jgi:hypothetical protein
MIYLRLETLSRRLTLLVHSTTLRSQRRRTRTALDVRQNDRKGEFMDDRRVLSAVLGLFLAIALCACGAEPAPTATLPPTETPLPPTPTPRPTATPTPALASAESILETSSNALEEAGSWHMEADIRMEISMQSLSVDVPIAMTMDFQAPDRSHATVSAELLGMALELETIIIGDTIYATDPTTGEWMVVEESVMPFSAQGLTGLGSADLEGLVLEGLETLDGVPVYHLVGTVSSEALGLAPPGLDADLGGKLQIEYWIGVEDDLPMQVALEGSVTAVGDELGTLGLEVLATFSDHGKPVKIEPPDVPSAAAAEQAVVQAPVSR